MELILVVNRHRAEILEDQPSLGTRSRDRLATLDAASLVRVSLYTRKPPVVA